MARPPKRTDDGAQPALVGTLERGLALLKEAGMRPDVSMQDLAQVLGLSRSTAYRIAERLRELGYLETTPTGHWHLGRETVQLGVAALQSADIMRVAPDRLQALLAQAQEAVNLAVFDADSMVLLYREQGPQSITVSSRLGVHRPMHASALGKAYLAAINDDERNTLLERISFKRFTASTLTSARAVRRDVAEIRERGYAIDRGEFEQTLGCCAAAVFDHRGIPIAAISVSGPAERVLPRIDHLGPLVAATARAISEHLGYREHAAKF
jgi:DNA-binding IclR family transcriptional regulator